MVNGPFTPGNGRIAADLYDFRKHVNGTDFTHNAASITASPGVSGATNVQTSIDNINSFIASIAGAGTAFIAIPDGYDCYVNPTPNFNFDPTVLPLNDFLTPLFAAITAGSTMPTGYERLKHGGILYIPAGTYYITSTVSVPPSITLLGEGYATKIINATSLDVSTSHPNLKLTSTSAPIFLIKKDINRSVNDTPVDAENSFIFSRATKFINLTIGDNFIEPTLLGDVYYTLPQNVVGDCPLIMQEQGSNFEVDGCIFMGRAFTTVEVVDTDGVTRFAIKLDTVTPNANGTILKVSNSWVDGFAQPISFNSSGGRNDYLDVNNCKIRAHGYLSNDGATAGNNCVINMNGNNANITSNDFIGNHLNLNQIVYIGSVTAGTLDERILPKITISSNNFSFDREGTFTVFDPAFTPYTIDASIVATILDKVIIRAFGNTSGKNSRGFAVVLSADGSRALEINNADTYINNPSGTTNINATSAYVNATSTINLGSTGYTNITASVLSVITPQVTLTTPALAGRIDLDGSIYSRVKTISATPYTMDSVSSDYVLMVDLTTIAAATTITLPAPTLGRTIIIKDKSGLANTYNVILDPKIGNCDTYALANRDGYLDVNGTTVVSCGQSFTGDGKTLIAVQFPIAKIGSPFGVIYFEIYAHTGTFGVNGIPTGAALASSGISTPSISGALTTLELSFTGANRITLVAGTKYFVVFYNSTGSDGFNVAIDSSSPSHTGNAARWDGTTWTADATIDICFNVITSHKIDGTASLCRFSANYGAWKFIGNGNNWYSI